MGIKNSAANADFKILQIINEPTASAISYGLNIKKNGIIAVYDLGGGTFDASILKIKNNIFEVLSTCGDSLLGGDDIDKLIYNYVKIQYMELYLKKYNNKLINCSKIKMNLSINEKYSF